MESSSKRASPPTSSSHCCVAEPSPLAAVITAPLFPGRHPRRDDCSTRCTSAHRGRSRDEGRGLLPGKRWWLCLHEKGGKRPGGPRRLTGPLSAPYIGAAAVFKRPMGETAPSDILIFCQLGA